MFVRYEGSAVDLPLNITNGSEDRRRNTLSVDHHRETPPQSCQLPYLNFADKDQLVFIITDKVKLVGEEVKGVGVMKDEELKLEEIEVSHTLGG